MRNFSTYSIYSHMPIWVQNIFCNIEGFRILRSRYGKKFQKVLKAAVNRDIVDQDTMQSYRNNKIISYLEYCSQYNVHIQKALEELKIIPSQVLEEENFHKLPISTKRKIHENYLQFQLVNPKKVKRITAHTSGSTGSGLKFYTTMSAIWEQWAVWWRYRYWHGISMTTRCGYFGGRSIVPIAQKDPPFWRYNNFNHQIMFSAYHISEDSIKHYINELRVQKPPWLHGYPSVLSLLASFILDLGLDIGYQVKWITTGSENLLENQKELIYRAFGVSPKQHYGLAEGVANFSECEYGMLHVDEDFSYVEFLPTGEENLYKIIGTSFNNQAFSFIRYDTNDVAKITGKTCKCNRVGRVVDAIDGRKEDYIVLRNGNLVGRLDHIFKDLTFVREAQMNQSEIGKVTILIVPRTPMNKSNIQQLLNEAYLRLGNDTEILIEQVANIEKTKNGKLRFVVSTIDSII